MITYLPSESVSEDPDKLRTVSDSILDAILEQDPNRT
jgi:S-adenosylmethionine synthetase